MIVAPIPSFTFNLVHLDSGKQLFILDVEEIDAELKQRIDNNFIKICEGISPNDLRYVKDRLITFLDSKRGTTIEMGAIAEFMVHLFLNENGFEPQFLFFNLEENSIKKGFDGYYKLVNDAWIMESKSGTASTKDISHAKKALEGYRDLNDKISGRTTNNPWQNAYSHASHIDVGADSTMRDDIRRFSFQFAKQQYHDIENFNIIPAATIFMDGNWEPSVPERIEREIRKVLPQMKCAKLNIVCVTKKSIEIFWNYLNND